MASLGGARRRRTRRVRRSWAAYLTRILEDTGYFVSVSAEERPQRATANVGKFREQLRGWSDDGVRESKQVYDVPLGLLLAGDTVRGGRPIETLGDGVVQLPSWLYLLPC